MPTRARSSKPAKSWSKKKADRRAVEQRPIDDDWASGIVRSLLESAHPRQHDYATDPSRFISAVVGRGGGKTSGDIIRKVVRLVTTHNARCVYVALTRTQAENLYWAPLKLAFEQLGFVIGEDVFFNETKLTCRVARTGATLRLVGADKKSEVEKLRGQPFHEVTIDEVASFPAKLLKYLIDEIITPRLGDYNGTLCLIGSPGKILSGLFYDVTRRGSEEHRRYSDRDRPEFAGWIGWSSHAWNLRDDVVTLPDAERRFPRLCNLWRNHLLVKARNRWSDDHPIWRREYLGEWAADDTDTIYKYRAIVDGKPWNRWNPPVVALKGLGTGFRKLPDGVKDWEYGYGLDLGSRDPFALNVLAFSPSDPERMMRHVFGFERRGMYAKSIAELLVGEDAVKQVMRGNGLPDSLGGLFGLTGWPIAIVADLAGLGEALIDELAKVYGIRIKGAEKGRDYKHGAIAVFNGHLHDARIQVIEDSDLEVQLLGLQWKPDEYGQPREDKGQANHSSDSALYITQDITAMFDAGGPPPKEPDAPYGEDDDPFERVGPSGADEYSGLLDEDSYDDLD